MVRCSLVVSIGKNEKFKFKTSAGEPFPTDLSAGALAVKANHKGTLESRAPRMRAHPYDSWYLGLGTIEIKSGKWHGCKLKTVQ